ncbi:MAG: translesion DNA synthesis-associated protein ImuA [Gammaproteobacteria bacterium]|nr:translesion DNA synthesis-associated protein ImuA [Gammaproteobacteria bacterium]
MTLEELMRRAGLWRAGEAPPEGGLSTGFSALDAILPGGGWPQPGLIEILATQPGIGALRLVLPALAALSRQPHWLIWVAPPHRPYAPALQAAGIDLAHVLLIDGAEPKAPAAAAPAATLSACWSWRRAAEGEFWAFEQALRFPECGAALWWPAHLEALALRRLQLACEAGGSLGILFRPAECAAQASPAALRLSVQPLAATPEVQVRILKCRGSLRARECRLSL